MNWQTLAEEVIGGKVLTDEEAMAILETDDDDLLPLLHGAFTIRKHYYGKKVKLNMIINAKSGYCPENCGYCAQSRDSTAPIEKYPFITKEQILEGARRAYENKAGTYCIVPTHSFTARLFGGTCSRSARAGRTMSGSMSSSYESNAKPSAATAQISHCNGVTGEGDGMVRSL